MADRKHKEASPEESGEKKEDSLGFAGYLGIVLLAGGLFNLPNIMKVPETTADKMMLVIVITMMAGGAILLLLRKR